MRPFKSKSNSKCKWFIQLIEIVRLGLKINTSLGFIEKNYKKHKYSEIFKIKGQEKTIVLKYQPEQSWIDTRKKKKNNVRKKDVLGIKKATI